MKRLIEKGLMFGNLVEVSSPQLVERYNRALKHLTGKQTALVSLCVAAGMGSAMIIQRV